MFLVAFYGLFHTGELASKSTRFAHSVVQYSNLTFLFRQGQVQGAKITITEYKHNASRRPFDILLAKDVSSPFCPVTALYQYCNIRGPRPGPLFCHADQTPSLFTTSLSHFSSAFLTVVWTVVGTRLITFALAARAMPLKKVILTRKFVLLVAGNPTHLKFIWGRKFFTLINWFAHVSKVGQTIGLLLGGLRQPFLTDLWIVSS